MTETLMNGAPPQSVGYASSSGYVDADLFLKHFVRSASPSTEKPNIIILDGHHSHKTLAAVEFCRANGIHLLTLPPHSTHKMQPLDRTYFKSMKSAFNNLADDYMVTNPGHPITINQMARLSGAAFLRYFFKCDMLRNSAHYCLIMTSPFSRYAKYNVGIITRLTDFLF